VLPFYSWQNLILCPILSTVALCSPVPGCNLGSITLEFHSEISTANSDVARECFSIYALSAELQIGRLGIKFQGSGWITGNPEGAAKLAANPAGEGPASRTCPVATVVTPDGRESDLSDRKLRSKSPSRQSASSVGSVRGASKSAGCSKRSEPLAAKSVRPAKAGMNSGCKSHRGKSPGPVA